MATQVQAQAAKPQLTTREEIATALASQAIDVSTACDLFAALDKTRSPKLTFGVSAKGALSVYGLQRWPVTLYVEQWERLIDAIPELQAFQKKHKSEFTRK